MGKKTDEILDKYQSEKSADSEEVIAVDQELNALFGEDQQSAESSSVNIQVKEENFRDAPEDFGEIELLDIDGEIDLGELDDQPEVEINEDFGEVSLEEADADVSLSLVEDPTSTELVAGDGGFGEIDFSNEEVEAESSEATKTELAQELKDEPAEEDDLFGDLDSVDEESIGGEEAVSVAEEELFSDLDEAPAEDDLFSNEADDSNENETRLMEILGSSDSDTSDDLFGNEESELPENLDEMEFSADSNDIESEDLFNEPSDIGEKSDLFVATDAIVESDKTEQRHLKTDSSQLFDLSESEESILFEDDNDDSNSAGEDLSKPAFELHSEASMVINAEELKQHRDDNLGHQDLPAFSPESDSEDLISELESEEHTFTMTSADILKKESVDIDSLEMSEEAKQKLSEIDEMLDSSESEPSIGKEVHPPLQVMQLDQTSTSELEITNPDTKIDLILSEVIEEESKVEEVIKPQESVAAPEVQISSSMPDHMEQDYKDVKEHYGNELEKLYETIRLLRASNEKLESKLENIQVDAETESRTINRLKAELDEKEIALELIETKYSRFFEELKTQVEILNDKKSYLELKNKKLEENLEDEKRKNKIDLQKIRQRELELEQSLSLLKDDAQAQVKNRDQIILELKRRVDNLEFDIESAQVKEKKIVTNKREIEDKMNNLISTLREALGPNQDKSEKDRRSEKIKKNLDL